MRWSVGCAALSLALFAVQVDAKENGGAKRLWLESKHQGIRAARSELSRVARGALPAVVSITTLQAATPDSDEESDEVSTPQKALGSGFIIHPDGFILTSFHVIDDAIDIKVAVNEGPDRSEVYSAKVVGRDEQTDVALLKIEPRTKLPVLPLGNTLDVDVADWVVVIGSPFGMANSVTVGVVSYKGRTGIAPNGKDGGSDYLQTDASINPGNSGGPVLNLNGEVIAIASAVNVAGQGIGFAIPIETAKDILPQLLARGSVRRGWIGMSVQDAAGDSLARKGVIVAEVLEGGPASRAGLRVGDVITSLGSNPIRRADALKWKVAALKIGEWMDLRVNREGKPIRLQIRLEEPPAPRVGAPSPDRLASDRDRSHRDESSANARSH